MPNREWRKNVVGTSNFFVGELAASLPTLISVLFRIALLYLFFWYFIDFIAELGCKHWGFAIWVGIAALVALVFLVWKLFNSRNKFDLDNNPPLGGLLPFVFLNFMPIASVAVAAWYGHCFRWGLLGFTQWALKRIGVV